MALTFLGGINLYERKNTFGKPFIQSSVPQKLIYKIPVGYRSLVEIDSYVQINTAIMCSEDGFNIYATVSGFVTEVTEDHIEIENDGEYETEPLFDEIDKPVKELSYDEILGYIKCCGIVGSYSGEPLYQKMQRSYEKVKRLVVNCVESDPSSGHSRTFAKEHTEEIIFGAKLLMLAMGITKAVIAFGEKDAKLASAFDKVLRKNDMIVSAFVDPKYPQGNDRLLITSIYNVEVPFSQTTDTCGYMVVSAETLYNVYNCIKNRSCVTQKSITLAGNAMKQPLNITARIGTPFRDVFSESDIDESVGIISGGILSGVPDENGAVTASTNVLSAYVPVKRSTYDCIRCSRCAAVCPMHLQPYKFKEHEHDENVELGIYNCIECGCCSYVCPSVIDLLGMIRSDKDGITYDEVIEVKTDELSVDESPAAIEEVESDFGDQDIPESEVIEDDKEEKENLISITDVDSYPEAKKPVDDLDADLCEELGNLLSKSETDSEEDESNDADE